MPQMKAAFQKLSTGAHPYDPKLTIVICGKRHHTRFFPTDAAHAAADGNPRPGTVVDRGTAAIFEYDFYLQAHGGLQGTTRPTHYYVVHDEIGIGADQLQGLTNDVSYLFARATKAVSLVSPAYYADIAAERGRSYIDVLLRAVQDDGRSTATGRSGPRTPDEREAERERIFQEAKRLWGNGLHKDLRDSMFYI